MSTVEIDVHLDQQEWQAALREEAVVGLRATPPWTSPVWFYDERGSDLFDQITRLPEYYPTRAERSILEAIADDLAKRYEIDTLVELGSGTSEKTRVLLDAFTTTGELRRFVPFDCSAATLTAAAHSIVAEWPGLDVQAVVGDFHHHLLEIPRGGRRLVAFLGSTVGNLDPIQRARFYFDIDAMLGHGDRFLLGTDLVKDPSRLVAAYDDAQGVTAAFNRNLLAVLNREFDGDFRPDAWAHRAVWDPESSRIEMRLVATDDQVVRLGALDLERTFAAGEWIRTEISTKFTAAGVTAELEAAGMVVEEQWTDDAGDFMVTLARAWC